MTGKAISDDELQKAAVGLRFIARDISDIISALAGARRLMADEDTRHQGEAILALCVKHLRFCDSFLTARAGDIDPGLRDGVAPK